MVENSLSDLRQMVERLPDLTDLVGQASNDNHVEYEVMDGTALGFRLWSQREVAIQRAFLTGGTTFPHHSHQEHEYLLVYEGVIQVEGNVMRIGTGKETHPGEAVYIPPNTPHSLYVVENCWLLGVTIPSAKGYPGVSR